MAFLAFDTLLSARRLQKVGFTPEQAEAQVEIMAEAFMHKVGSLVTQEYLDARLEALEARVDAKLRVLLWGHGLVIAVLVIPAMIDMLA